MFEIGHLRAYAVLLVVKPALAIAIFLVVCLVVGIVNHRLAKRRVFSSQAVSTGQVWCRKWVGVVCWCPDNMCLLLRCFALLVSHLSLSLLKLKKCPRTYSLSGWGSCVFMFRQRACI